MKNKFPLLFLILIGAPFIMHGQVYVFAGAHQSYVRNDILVNALPIYTWHSGGGITIYPTTRWKKTSVNAEFALFQKGYDQHLGNQQFELRFRYLTWQATLSYDILPFVSVKAGANLALLFDSNMKRWTTTYQFLDVGAVAGLGFLEKKRISFYTRLVYGLTPMLKYSAIDAMGNFNGTIHDLKNTCFMVGLRINIYDKKIHFRH